MYPFFGAGEGTFFDPQGGGFASPLLPMCEHRAKHDFENDPTQHWPFDALLMK